MRSLGAAEIVFDRAGTPLEQLASRFGLEPPPPGANAAVQHSWLVNWQISALGWNAHLEAASQDFTEAKALRALGDLETTLQQKAAALVSAASRLNALTIASRTLRFGLIMAYRQAAAGVNLHAPTVAHYVVQQNVLGQAAMARDYYYRLAVFQAIVALMRTEAGRKIVGAPKASDGLGDVGVIVAIVVVAGLALAALAAIVVSIYFIREANKSARYAFDQLCLDPATGAVRQDTRTECFDLASRLTENAGRSPFEQSMRDLTFYAAIGVGVVGFVYFMPFIFGQAARADASRRTARAS